MSRRRVIGVGLALAMVASVLNLAGPALSLPPGVGATIITIAGDGADATVDGIGPAASFKTLGGAVQLGSEAFVATEGAIRRVDLLTFEATLVAGDPVKTSCKDHEDFEKVEFLQIVDIASNGSQLYTTSSCNKEEIRRTALSDGATAKFAELDDASHLVVALDGFLYVTTGAGGTVERVALGDGVSVRNSSDITTFATLGGSAYDIAADANALWIAVEVTPSDRRIERVSLATGSVTTFVSSPDLGLDALGAADLHIYATDAGGSLLRRYDIATGTEEELAGTAVPGFADGTGSDAAFAGITALLPDGGVVWIADSGNRRFRQGAVAGELGVISGDVWVDLSNDGVFDGAEPPRAGVLLTLKQAGTGTPLATKPSEADGAYSFTGLSPGTYLVEADGGAGPVGSTLKIPNPRVVVVGFDQSVPGVDFRFGYPGPRAVVETFAGDGQDANIDDFGVLASFGHPGGVAVDGDTAYVGTVATLRRVDLVTAEASFLAGDTDQHPNQNNIRCEDNNNPNAVRFAAISDVETDGTTVFTVNPDCPGEEIRTTDASSGATTTLASVPGAIKATLAPDGFLYVTTGANQTVEQVDPATGSVTSFVTLAGDTHAISSDADSLWVAVDLGTSREIVQVALAGAGTTTMVSDADIGLGALVASGDFLYGSGGADDSILRRYSKADGTIVDLAGGAAGFSNGVAGEALFDGISGLAGDESSLWIVDGDNFRLRRAVVIAPLASVGGFLFDDTNFDGIWDVGEPPLQGVTVELFDSSPALAGSTVTDLTGFYQFLGLTPGGYSVDVDESTLGIGFVLSTGNDPQPVVVAEGEDLSADDIGFRQHSDLAVTKTPVNGFPFVGEDVTFTIEVTNLGPAPASNLELTDALGPGLTFVSATPSDGAFAAGTWTIPTLAVNASATLELVATADVEGVLTNTVATISLDQHDPNPANNEAVAEIEGVPLGTISGGVFNDLDADGVLDGGEGPFGGVTVELVGSFDEVLDTAVTAGDGSFTFEDLKAGGYRAVVDESTLPPDQILTTSSDPIVVGLGEDIVGLEIGYVTAGEITGTVFTDLNVNAVNDAEAGLEAVRLRITDVTRDRVLEAAVTDINGAYGTGDILPGDYLVEVLEETVPTTFGLTTDNNPTTVTVASGATVDVEFGYAQALRFNISDAVFNIRLISPTATDIISGGGPGFAPRATNLLALSGLAKAGVFLATPPAPPPTEASTEVQLVAADRSNTTFVLSSSEPWLTITPNTGTTPQTILITADATGLAAGIYVAVVVAVSDTSTYATATFTVTLVVTEEGTVDVSYDLGLMVAKRSDHVGAEPVLGATVADDVFFFPVPNVSDSVIDQIAYEIFDDLGVAQPGTAQTVPSSPFYYFPTGFDTTALTDGDYTLEAELTLAGGAGTRMLSSAFAVFNPPPPDPLLADGVGLFDESAAEWHLRTPLEDLPVFQFGVGGTGQIGLVGDWDGDGVDSIGVYQPLDQTFELRNSNSAGAPDITSFSIDFSSVPPFVSTPAMIPVAGDWNNNGKSGVGLFDPTIGAWYLSNPVGGGAIVNFDPIFGLPGDTPVVGDWDGDGTDTIGLYRDDGLSPKVLLRNSNTSGFAEIPGPSGYFYGAVGDLGFVGNWDGDMDVDVDEDGILDGTGVGEGVDTVGVFRPSDTTFYIRHSNTLGFANLAFPFGDGTWQPVAGRFAVELSESPDGVGIMDIQSGWWHLLKSDGATNTFWYEGSAPGPNPLRPGVLGDWDGDGVDTVAIYGRSAVPGSSSTDMFIHLRNSNTQAGAEYRVAVPVGEADWEPISGDWNNNGTDGLGLYDPVTREFRLWNDDLTVVGSLGAPAETMTLGAVGDTPIAGDFDNNGRDDVGVFGPGGNFFFNLDFDNDFEIGPLQITGIPALATIDRPVIGNFDGLGVDDFGIYDTSLRKFYLRTAQEATGTPDITVDLPTDTRPNEADLIAVAGQFGTEAFAPVYGELGFNRYAAWRGDVNMLLGNFVHSDSDISLSTPGPALDVTRTYNSRSDRVGAFGLGWTFAFDMKLNLDIQENGYVVYPDGRVEFHRKVGSSYEAPEGYSSELEETGVAEFTLTTKNRMQYVFQAGRLEEITDSNGRTVTLQYDFAGNLQLATADGGRRLIFTMTSGLLTQVRTDPFGSGLEWMYYYEDPANPNLLTHACDPRDNSLTGSCTVYEYDSQGRLVSVTKPKGNLDVEVAYNIDGSVFTRTDAQGNATTFSQVGPRRTQVTDARGFTATQLFDDEYRLIEETDAEGKTTKYTYNDDGYRDTITDPNDNTATLVYDAEGNVTEVTNAEGETTFTKYDAADNVIEVRDGRSASAVDNTFVVTYTYDDPFKGNRTSQVLPASPGSLTDTPTSVVMYLWEYTNGTEAAIDGGTQPPGLLRKAIDGRNNSPSHTTETLYEYDEHGDLRRLTDRTGFVTEFTYDILGRRLTEIQKNVDVLGDITTTWTYDDVFNVETVTEPAVTNVVSVVTHQRKITNTYDPNQNLVATVEEDLNMVDPSRTTIFGYDSLERQTAVIDPEAGLLGRTFDQVGNVITVTDQKGRTIRTDYDGRNLPTKVTAVDFTDPDGTVRDIVVSTTRYDNAGRLGRTTDAEGRETRYTYDGADRVTDVKLLDYDNLGPGARNMVLAHNEYDDAGNMILEEMGDPLLVGNNSRTFVHEYDEASRLVKTTLDPGGLDRVTTFIYDPDMNLRFQSNSEAGRTDSTAFLYDAESRLIQTNVDNGGIFIPTINGYDNRGTLTSVTDPRGNTTLFDNDELGRLFRTTSPSETFNGAATPGVAITRVGYDTFGNVTHSEDARSKVTETSYDRLDRRVRIEHPDYTRLLDFLVVEAEETFGYDRVGNLVAQTSRRGFTTEFDFDDFNRVVRQTDPTVDADEDTERGVVTSVYDDVGNLVQAVDQRGALTTLAYDDRDRVRTVTQHVREIGGPGVDMFTTTTDYDDLGGVIFVKAPDNGEAETVYNPAGEPINVTDELDEVTSFEYVLGRQTKVTDPLDRTIETTYDSAGRPTDVKRFSGAGAVFEAHEHSGFDKAGNVTDVTSPRGMITGVPNPDFTSSFTYDKLNRLTQVVEPITASDSITSSFEYDRNGNVTEFTNGEGHSTTYQYNEWNLRHNIIEPATAQHPVSSFKTIFDAGGLAIQSSAPGPTLVHVTRVFDGLGRLISETGAPDKREYGYDLAGFGTESHVRGRGTQTFEFDDRGLLVSSSVNDLEASFGYDPVGRLGSRVEELPSGIVSTDFTWTSRGELDTAFDSLTGVTRDYQWDVASQLDMINFSNGSVQSFGYDGLGRLESDEVVSGTGTVAQFDYSYDRDGNLEMMTVGGVGLVGANTEAGTHTYMYDNLGRLKSWDSPSSPVASYVWDKAGNRIQAGTDVYGFDERNRLVSGPEGDYAYTARGTLESLTLGSQVTEYDFDDLGRLESVDDGVTPVSYLYDSMDRVATRDSGVVELFSYAGMAIDASFDGVFSYARSPGGRLLAQEHAATGVSQLVGLNRHGDVSYLMDPIGFVTDSVLYDPFGDVAGENGATDGRVGFQGDFTDPVTDHVWMGARWYDGGWATFLSRDSVFGELRTPVTLNRYTYAGANPLKFWDPDGRYLTETTTDTGPSDYFYDINTCGYSGCNDEVQIGTAVRTQCVRWHDSAGCTEYEIVEVTGATNPEPETSTDVLEGEFDFSFKPVILVPEDVFDLVGGPVDLSDLPSDTAFTLIPIRLEGSQELVDLAVPTEVWAGLSPDERRVLIAMLMGPKSYAAALGIDQSDGLLDTFLNLNSECPVLGRSATWLFGQDENFCEGFQSMSPEGQGLVAAILTAGPAGIVAAGTASIVLPASSVTALGSGGLTVSQQLAYQANNNSHVLDHIFRPSHPVMMQLETAASRTAILRDIITQLPSKLPANQTIYENVIIGGQKVEVQGRVVDGVFRISSAFVR